MVFTVAVPVVSAGDHWITVEVRGTPPVGSPYDLLVPRSSLDVALGNFDRSIGFTNPIFIDKTGNGIFEPNTVP